MKQSYITVTDQFCGAGGSSQGIRRLAHRMGGGLEVKLALNHWKLAIETHSTNFPDTLHDCTDISACDPRRYPSTDILITSPECTNHSLAKGKKVVKAQLDMFDKGILDAAAERSRATMWDVPRFAEYHGYRIIIVENVVDARKWVMFDAWLHAMHSLGYHHRCVYLNSMHAHPTPQSRDRMYVVFWKKGQRAPDLEFYPVAHCGRCGKDVQSVQTWKRADVKFGKYRQQYVYCCPECTQIVEPYYYAAMNAIDWTKKGQRIGERKKPLAPKTIDRINFGLKKYKDYPFVVNNQHSTGVDFRVRGMEEQMQTMTGTNQMSLVVPFIVKLEHNFKVDPVTEAERTQTGRQSSMLVYPATHAMPTQTTCQGMGVVVPMVVDMHSNGKGRPATEALSTCTAGAAKNGIVTTEAWNTFFTYFYKQHQASHVTDELKTVTCKERSLMVSYTEPRIEDCYYRMLDPLEVQLAMAFDREYVILGTAKDKVKQCGNAVTPPAMEMLVERCIQSLS